MGLQGSGKTTTAAKLARRLKQEQKAPFLVAADVYRPADVVFMVEGEVIRHRGGEERSSQGLGPPGCLSPSPSKEYTLTPAPISQLRGDQGVAALIEIAQTHRDRHVRRKAMFWLGQSDDARVIALFEEMLLRR